VTRDLAPPNGSNETPNCANNTDVCTTRIAFVVGERVVDVLQNTM
jgi:hypothetical protein